MSETNPMLAAIREADKPKSKYTTAEAAPTDLKRGSIGAISSYWDFIKLLRFKGGINSFSLIHRDIVSFLTEPQSACSGPYRLGGINTNAGRRRLLLIPRGHLKSTLCSVGYVLWRIYRNPNIRIAVGCATKDLALQFVREIKQYLEDEELQDTVWNKRPHIQGRMIPVLDKAGARRRDRMREEDDYTEATDKKVVWRSDAIQVLRSEIMREPTVLATSPGSNVTGMHFDLFIKDDIVNDDTVATEDKIEKTLNWAQDLESVLDPQRKVLLWKHGDRDYWEIVGDEDITLGTRYAKHDYYDYLLENADTLGYKSFVRNVYVNGQDASDGYIWPEKFNDYTIQNLKKRISPKRFASQYLNSIIVLEEQPLKIDNIHWVNSRYIEINGSYVTVALPEKQAVNVMPHLVLDPAISQKKNADNSVLLVGGVDNDRNLYLFEFAYGKWLPEEMIAHLFRLAAKWNCMRVTVEVVAFQKVIAHMIRSSFARYKPIGVIEYTPKGEKKGRILTYLQPLFDNKMIYAAHTIALIPQFREEIEYFSTSVNSNIHDDFVDAMAILVETAIPTFKNYKEKSNVLPFGVNRKYGGIY